MRARLRFAVVGAMLSVACSVAWSVTSSVTAAQAEAEAAPAGASAPPATNWKQIAIPALPAFEPKRPARVVLPDGMVVLLTEDHELPLISGSATLRGGSDSEPAEKTGLVELYGATWRTGGTETLTGDQLDDYLEARAAHVETGGGDASTSIGFDCLKADLPEVFGVFSDLLRHPAFREDKLSLAKKEMDSNISRRNDETGGIAGIETEILGYGKQSAYARVPEYATVAAVTRQDLIDWHGRHVAPNNIILGIVGDFDSKEMEARLRKAFDEWPAGEKVAEPEVKIEPAKPGLYVVDKSEVNQSEIRMIETGIERRSPDYYAVQVMNEIFGGGFSSRLFINLRTKAGLAYSVGGGVGTGWDHPGLTVLHIGTKTETTVDAVKGMWEQVELLKKAPPSDAEMKRAKDAILNSFIFNFDTPSNVLHEQQTYEFYGYPSDFLERYRSGVEKVTPDDVLRVARQYLHQDQLKVLVVGNASGFEKQLAALGPVTPIDITIPSAAAKPAAGEPASASGSSSHTQPEGPALPAAMASPTPASAEAAQQSGTTPAAAQAEGKPAEDHPAEDKAAEGRAAMARLLASVGGAEKVNAVKTLQVRMELFQETTHTKTQQTTVFPDKQEIRMIQPQGLMRQVVTPDEGFLSIGSELRELTPEQRAQMLFSIKREFVSLLQHLDDPKYSFEADGKQMLGKNEATVVKVTADGETIRLWIGPDGLLWQEEYSAAGSEGKQKSTTEYRRWKDFGGLKYPTDIRNYHHGDLESALVVAEVAVNPAPDPNLFARPKPKAK